MKKILWFILIITLTACTGPQIVDRAQWKKITSRVYDDVPNDNVILAGKELFRLAYGDNVKLTNTNEGFIANHYWTKDYLLFTADYIDSWMLRVSPGGNGSKVTVQLSHAGPDTKNDGNESMPGIPINSTAIYDLFWSRLDYLLGKRSSWMTCDTSNEEIKKKNVWGSNSALCNLPVTKDNSPVSPILPVTQTY